MTLHFTPASDETQRFIAFDYARNTIYSNTRSMRLAAQQADILHVLLENRPNAISIGNLAQLVYGAKMPEDASNSMRVAIHALRRKLAGTGLNVTTRARAGYAVELDESSRPDSDLRKNLGAALEAALKSGDQLVAEQIHGIIKDLSAPHCGADRDRIAPSLMAFHHYETQSPPESRPAST